MSIYVNQVQSNDQKCKRTENQKSAILKKKKTCQIEVVNDRADLVGRIKDAEGGFKSYY